MLFQTSNRCVGDVLVLDCKGRLVSGEETAFLRHQVRDFLNEYQRIVVNLSDVDYVDSTGLGTLVGLYTSAQNKGCKIMLAGLTRKIKDLLQITKLVTVFETFESIDDAIVHLRREQTPAAATLTI
jgi:anti-sigma B factor antagonist